MATTRGAFSQLLAPGLNAVMMAWLDEHPEEFSNLCNIKQGKGAFEEDQVIAGLGLVREKPEGTALTYDDPIEGGSVRYIHTTYALGWQATQEMISDDRYDIMSKQPKELIISARQTIEQVGHAPLNNGFTTTTTADGETLFNTAHPLLGGGTYSNQLNPDADVSVTAFQDIIMLFENMVDERGRKRRLSPRKVCIPPELQFKTGEVLQSSLQPGTGNNTINVMQGRLEPQVHHYFTSTTAWFVSCGNDCNYVNFYWRERPKNEVEDDFDTKGVKHSIDFRISSGATHWNGWAGSNP